MTNGFNKILKFLQQRDYSVLLVVYVIFLVVLSPFGQSLWLDETVSYWVLSDDLKTLVERVLRFQGQSPFYYTFLWAFSKLFGTSEVALRAPSFIFFLAALFCLYRITSVVFDQKTAVVAGLLFSSIDEVRVAAVSARPYSLALFCAFLSAYFLIKLMQNGSKWSLFGFIISSVLSFYAHYLFALIVVPHAVIAFFAGKRGHPIFFKQFLVALLFIGILCLPGLFQLSTLFLRRGEISFVEPSSFGALAEVLFLPYLLITIFLSLIFVRIYTPLIFDKAVFFKSKTLAGLVFYLAAPVFFFLISLWGNGVSFFLPRYFLWYSGGLAIIYALLCCAFKEQRGVGLLIPVLCFLLLIREAERRWQVEDWRAAVARAEEIADKEGIGTFVFYSGLIEAGRVDFIEDQSTNEYLKAPLEYYKTKRKIVLLPFDLESPESRDYLERNVSQSLGNKAILLSLKQKIIDKKQGVDIIPNLFSPVFEQKGLTLKEERDFGQVRLLLFGR